MFEPRPPDGRLLLSEGASRWRAFARGIGFCSFFGKCGILYAILNTIVAGFSFKMELRKANQTCNQTQGNVVFCVKALWPEMRNRALRDKARCAVFGRVAATKRQKNNTDE